MSAAADPGRRALGRWLLGLLSGGLLGSTTLVLGTIGVVLVAALIAVAAFDRPRGAGLSGALVGVGAAWLLALALIARACPGPAVGSGCTGPDVVALLPIPIVLLVVGGLIGLVSAQRSR